MYPVPVNAVACPSRARAIPKSMTFAEPAAVTMTLAGLMSRWTRPRSWPAASASRISAVNRSASASGRPPRRDGTKWLRVRPSTYSITRNDTRPSASSSSPTSCTATTWACMRAAADRASRRNRSRPSVSAARSGLIVLIATVRSRTVSRARCTDAIPPVPTTDRPPRPRSGTHRGSGHVAAQPSDFPPPGTCPRSISAPSVRHPAGLVASPSPCPSADRPTVGRTEHRRGDRRRTRTPQTASGTAWISSAECPARSWMRWTASAEGAVERQ